MAGPPPALNGADWVFERVLCGVPVTHADIAAMVKDADGNIIGGSMTDAVETHDIWTFMRDVKSGGRNWKLDETDSV